MATIIENIQVSTDTFLMRLSGVQPGEAGQFYMLRETSALDPFLGRPISLFDFDVETGLVSFLYQSVGRATKRFSNLRKGEEMLVQGPYGNGFPRRSGDAILIGGGIGIAPLFYLAKCLRAMAINRRITVHLGFREEAYLEHEFAMQADHLHCKIGGFVTDDVDFSRPGTFYACGPTPMLEAAVKAARQGGARLYVSLESHMACGVGVCLGCSCKTVSGNQCICKDGPVFLAEEVFLDA